MARVIPGAAGASGFLVGQDRDGHWLARDEAGLVGGLFVDKAAALRFAEDESRQRRCRVRLAPPRVALRLSGPLAW